MEVIVKKRNSGKTTELIKLSSKNGGTIVCCNTNEVNDVLKEATKIGLSIPVPISWWDFTNRKYDKGTSSFLIDNADDLLLYIAVGIKIEAITITDYDKD